MVLSLCARALLALLKFEGEAYFNGTTQEGRMKLIGAPLPEDFYAALGELDLAGLIHIEKGSVHLLPE